VIFGRGCDEGSVQALRARGVTGALFPRVFVWRELAWTEPSFVAVVDGGGLLSVGVAVVDAGRSLWAWAVAGCPRPVPGGGNIGGMELVMETYLFAALIWLTGASTGYFIGRARAESEWLHWLQDRRGRV
jgi:hypothetical protein